MNKIQKCVYQLVSIADKAGVELKFDTKELIKELTEGSYKNNAIENLVNISNISSNALNIGDILSEGIYEEDYEILTHSRTNSDGDSFDTEEEYNEYVQNKADEEFEGYYMQIETEYAIVDPNNNNRYIEGGFKSLEDAEHKLDNYVSSYEVKHYSQCEILDSDNDSVESFDEFIDEDAMRKMAEEKIEELKEEFIEDEENWDDLYYEYDEVYYNVVRNFSDEANIESAKKAGLGVIHLSKLDEDFLFLRGCGMDLSFCFLKYLAYEYGCLTEEYLDKLEWTKMNSGEDEFRNILTCLGVDVDRLSM